MNPQDAETLKRAQQMKSIEAFQRDIEPAIIAARDAVINSENIRAYYGEDNINEHTVGDERLYTMVATRYFFEEADVDKVRSAIDSHLKPLGFTIMEDQYVFNGNTRTEIYWLNEKYGATISIQVSPDVDSSYGYRAVDLLSDGSVSDPTQLLELPGRTPAWFDPSVVPLNE